MADQIQNDVEEESSGFDAIGFAESIYSIIDSYRSQMPADYQSLMANPTQNPGGLGETKINAFFRILGLPANSPHTAKQSNIEERDFSRVISQDGTLNYFSNIRGEDEQSELFFRNIQLTAPPNPEEYANFMQNPIHFADSVKNSGSSKRASLFPLVVDSAVPVYPLSRRLAPSFQHSINGEDYIVSGSKKRLSRPLIDNIIYIRSKKINNEAGIAELRKQLTALAASIADSSSQDIEKSIQDTNINFVELSIRTKLLETLKNLANRFKTANSEIQELSSKITFVPVPVSNPAQRSAQNANFKLDAKVGYIDSQIAEIKSEIANKNAIAWMLPTEEIKRREEVRRLEQDINLSNISSDVLISQITSLITYEVDGLKAQLADLEHQKDNLITQAEGLKQQMLYYTGQFSGLSIFDVISVIYGLFAVDFKYLIGLLNADARGRLAEDEFFSTNDTEETVNIDQLLIPDALPSIADSLNALEEKVAEAFKIAEGFANTQAVKVGQDSGRNC